MVSRAARRLLSAVAAVVVVFVLGGARESLVGEGIVEALCPRVLVVRDALFGWMGWYDLRQRNEFRRASLRVM